MICGYSITSQGEGIASWPYADIFIPSNQKAVTIYADFYRPQSSGSALDFSAAYCAGCSESDLVDWSSYPNFSLWNYDTIPFPMYGTELLFDDISNSEVIGPGYLRILAPLTQVNDEWNDLCIGFLELSGCMDDQACNYSEGILISNPESCDYSCCPGPGCCHEGTIWNSNLQQCIVANPSDSNFDGCVQLNDLLDLLSAYGDCGAEESAWQCGDPLEYQGYDYETVQIGEQCWFAENLRKLDFVFPGNDDKSISEPRAYVQGYNGYEVEEAILSDNFQEYGALYNYPAVLSESLCPSGWSPGTDQDWIDLVVTLGVDSVEANTYTCCDGEEYRGDVADLLKDESWQGGINTSGFSALPAGFVRANGGGSFDHLGTNGYFWTTSEAVEEYSSQGMLEETAMIHYLFSGVSGVGRIVTNRAQAFSVRCIKDAE